MKRPYSDNAKANPEAIMNEDILLRRGKESHDHGFPVAIHATCCVGNYVISRVGEERMPNVYNWRRMLDNGIQLSLSSDWGTSPLNPLEHIAMAMKRETKIGRMMTRWDDARQALTFEEALYA